MTKTRATLPQRPRPETVNAAILDRLKKETGDMHDAIELNPRLCRIVAPDLSIDEYAGILARLHPFHVAMDKAIAEALWDERNLDLSARAKAPLIRVDLAKIGKPMPEGPEWAGEPIEDAAAAWGALYVCEGATLGGRIILKRLRVSLGLEADTGAAYYAGYGEETGPMWQAFRRRLAEVVDEHPDWADGMVASACRAYRSLDAWVAA